MLIDILIILLILTGGYIGAKRGFSKQIVTVVGFVLVLILSFLLKDKVANLLMRFCPFFKFDGLTSLNILLYEALSVILLMILFESIVNIVINLTTWFEKILDRTIILGVVSKIIGFILGVIEYIAISFILLTFVSIKINTTNAKLSIFILNHTPILSSYCDSTIKTINDISDLREKYQDNKNNTQMNQEILDLMVDNKVISIEKVTELLNDGKLVM